MTEACRRSYVFFLGPQKTGHGLSPVALGQRKCGENPVATSRIQLAAWSQVLVRRTRPTHHVGEEQTRQGLGKYTRIRRRDYPKLTRCIKQIPTCWGHICCSDPGEKP